VRKRAAVAGAAWAIGELRQADDETVAALLARVHARGDPPLLVGDLVGALTAVSGCRFGYDVAAWRAWASARRNCAETRVLGERKLALVHAKLDELGAIRAARAGRPMRDARSDRAPRD
jgi:hypothetical protein